MSECAGTTIRNGKRKMEDVLAQILASGWWYEIDGKDCQITLEARPAY